MKITLLLVFGVLFSVTVAVAGDLQEQPSCNFPAFLKDWQVSKPSAYLAGEKNIPMGQTVGIGDVVFYATFKDAKKFYKATEDVLLKDKSPLNPDSKILSGQQIPVVAIMTNINDGTSFDVIEAPGGMLSNKLFPVKPDGFICSTRIDTTGKGANVQWTTAVGMPLVMQGSPLTQTKEEVQGAKSRSVAIVLQKIDGAIASVEVSLIENGKQVKTVTNGYDLFAGALNLSGLSIQIKKEGAGIKIVSVSEPTDWYNWISLFFKVGV